MLFDRDLFFLVGQKVRILSRICGSLDNLHVSTFLREENKQDGTMMPLGRNNHSPAVNSVPANVAVFKNSSKSFSCVTDLRRDVESMSVVYLKRHIEP